MLTGLPSLGDPSLGLYSKMILAYIKLAAKINHHNLLKLIDHGDFEDGLIAFFIVR